MRNGFVAALVAITWLGLVRTSFAALMLTLSSPNDLDNLMVGDVATINVELSGLIPLDQLETLAATVEFDALVFGTPIITDGPIVPDTTGVLKAESLGQADYSYSNLLSDSKKTIVANGLFFVFDVPVANAGEGEISITAVDSSGFGDEGNDLPLVDAGDPLPYRASGTSNQVVPAPSSCVVLVGLFAMALIGHWRKWTHRAVG